MEACMAAVLVGVMDCPVVGAGCLVCELCLLTVVLVDCRWS